MNHNFIELMFSSTTPVSPVAHPLAALFSISASVAFGLLPKIASEIIAEI